jgi:hypothetical protein
MVVALMFAPSVSAQTRHRMDTNIPAATLKFCKAKHIACAGQWKTVGNERMFQLATPVHITKAGDVVATPDTNYYVGSISNLATGTCWSSLGGGNGQTAELYGCNGSANQSWWMDTGHTSYGGFVFYNAGDQLCLNNTNGSSSDGNKQQMWSCYNSQNETYYVNSRDQGYSVQPYAGGCLSSVGNSGNGAPIELYGCNFGANQTWEGNF